jgi:hypothetical protein
MKSRVKGSRGTLFHSPIMDKKLKSNFWQDDLHLQYSWASINELQHELSQRLQSSFPTWTIHYLFSLRWIQSDVTKFSSRRLTNRG